MASPAHRETPSATGCPSHVDYRPVELADGFHAGTRATAEGITLTAARGVCAYTDPFAPQPVPRRFAHASWTTAEVEPGFVFNELVPTWHARTPDAGWLEVEARVRVVAPGQVGWSGWLLLARWADHDAAMHPTSLPRQRRPMDGPSSGPAEVVAVDIDTIRMVGAADAWQVRVTLLRPEQDTEGGPVLTYLGVMASSPRPACANPPSPPSPLSPSSPLSPAVGRPGVGAARALDVPAFSQRIHPIHPVWGGGDVWCSPVAVAMVLAYWGAGPDAAALAWVDEARPDRMIYHAVRHCWDYAYDSAGNWSFNTAYAASFGLDTFVTRLRDLTEVEAFIRAGIPLVASVRVDPARLHGADYTSAGHLVVVVGFTEDGDVVVHDPGAGDRATVRRVYRRDEFEHAWCWGSGGIVYVIHPPAVGLPRRPAEPNW